MPPSARRLARALGAVLAVGVVAAGCAHAGAPAAAPPLAGPVPVLLRSADLHLPLDDYRTSVADSYLLSSAHRALLSACMHELGLDFTLPEAGPPPGPRTWTDRRYGLTDPAQAAGGYWAAERTGAVGRTAAAVRQRTGKVTPAEGAAVTGRGAPTVNGHPVPPGGCADEAERRLAAHDPAGADLQLGQRLDAQTFAESQRDPRVTAVVRQWSGCMRTAGFSYPGPLDPSADPRFRHALSRTEVAVAHADLACKQRTNLVGVWFAVESGRQQSLIDANRPALDLTRRATQAELAVARAALR